MQGERPIVVAICFGGVCALVLTVLLNAREGSVDDVERSRDLVLTALCVLPTVLAAGALAGRPVLLLPATFAAILAGPLLWSGLPLMWVPAGLYVWAFTRSAAVRRPALLPVVIPAILTLAAVYLFFAGIARELWAAAAPSGDYLAASVTCAGLAAVAGWVLARPRTVRP
jgi:hypothetical protein